MKVLVACEYSATVREAFAKRGHDAWSCDVLPTDVAGQHFQCDVREVLDKGWDLMIAHPPCTYLTVTGAKWFYHPDDKDLPTSERRPHPKFPNRKQQQAEAIEFFLMLANANIDKIAVENPVSVISSVWRKPDQIIQPFDFGHPEPKKTCLWLKNLPHLKPTNIVQPEYHMTASGKRVPKWFFDPSPSPDRWKMRSKTFQGIADAMAEQWG